MRRSLFLLAALLTAFALHAQSIDTAAVDRIAADALTAWHAPGIAVAIVVDDKVVVAKGYGLADVGANKPATPDTLFEIASATKAFTATAMAMLADDKKLDWDDPVRKHLPWFRVADPNTDALLTLRDLVSHRSGLGRHDELWDLTAMSRDELLHRVITLPPARPIRTGYIYNNLMFVAAGESVAAASRMPWDEFIRTRVFTPLGMTHSRITFAEWNASDHATSYRWKADCLKTGAEWPPSAPCVLPNTFTNYDVLGPAGTIKSSARDMAQWLRFQLAGGAIDGKRLLSQAALDETHMPQLVLRRDSESRETSPETNVASYAMGWNVMDYRGEMLIAHAGALNAFRTQVALLPNHHAGVVVMTNISRGLAAVAVRNAVLDRLLGGTTRDWNAYLLAADKKSDERDATTKRERDTKRVPDTKPSHDLAAYAGTYESSGYGTATITVEGGSLVLHWGRTPVPLTHWHYDTFCMLDEVNEYDELVEFRSDATDGHVRSMTFFGQEMTRK
jgi:CubicO group peptidase (beta-lactamase class C family)